MQSADTEGETRSSNIKFKERMLQEGTLLRTFQEPPSKGNNEAR
jgi:hypothetical protein